MPARKRGIDEVDSSVVAPVPLDVSPRHKIRNCWQFAALMQYIFFFGQAVKIDQNLDVDELEAECLKPQSEKLAEIGLALLKYVSSHKGLTPEIFDEYTRRQYLAKAPQRNPFGSEEEPLHFVDFDVFTKLSVLHQLSVWTLNNPDRIREKMEEKEPEQTQWRIEPLGWDKDERSYFVLDDDRLYRRTDPKPPAEPAPKPKAKAKPRGRKGRRQSKRIKVTNDDDDDLSDVPSDLDGEETTMREEDKTVVEDVDDGLGGAKWVCIAVSHEEYKAFLETIQKSRDPDEKVLYKRILSDVLPIIEKRAEAQERKAAARRREMENIEKLATAKRSSRISARVEKQKEVQDAEEAERKKRSDLVMAKREQEKQRNLEDARESRMMTREQRLKDREMKRILHEEELSRLRQSSVNTEASNGRSSERHRHAEMEKRERALQELKEEAADDWYFDCAVCGTHGMNIDDGTHSIACEKCNVWQHSACHGITPAEAERDDFHFVCASCRKTGLKLRLGPSTSPEDKPKQQAQTNGHTTDATVSAPAHQTNGHHQPGPPPQGHFRTSIPPSSPAASLPAQQNGSVAVNGFHPPGNEPPYQPHQQMQAPQQTPAQQPPVFAKPFAAPATFAPPTHNGHASGRNTFTSPAPRQPPSQPAMTPHTSFALSGNSVAATPAASFQPQFQQTPASASRPAIAAASFANSPTPSLSATQGSDFRFVSASVHPPRAAETPRTTHNNDDADFDQSNVSEEPFYSPEGVSFVSASAYIPATSAPTASGISPIKHDPLPRSASPQLPALPSTERDADGAESPRPRSRGHRESAIGLPDDTPVPDLRSSPEIDDRIAGMSPTKHDLPPSSPMMPDFADVEGDVSNLGDVSMLDAE